jgi:hypothetical protein
MAKRAPVTPERREHDAALLGRVAMLEQVTRHELTLPVSISPDIGAAPWTDTLIIRMTCMGRNPQADPPFPG